MQGIAPEDRTAFIYNEMKDTYDDLRDLWYSWLFSRLHYFIARDVIRHWKSPKNQRVLDIGCGTGFQSFLYASVGAEVIGIDIAQALLESAQAKALSGTHTQSYDLFPAHFPFVTRYNIKIRRLLEQQIQRATPVPPEFRIGSACNLPFEDNLFSHVSCCGSVLSCLEEHLKALDEIHRVLRPGGTYFLEVEAKFNPDMFWPLVDALVFRGRLGYETEIREAWDLISSPPKSHIFIEYPFGEIRDPVYMNIKLFSKTGLSEELQSRKLPPNQWWTIHSFTNLIPSTLLDSDTPGKLLRTTFYALSRLEELCPVGLPGCSLVISGRKSN